MRYVFIFCVKEEYVLLKKNMFCVKKEYVLRKKVICFA